MKTLENDHAKDSYNTIDVNKYFDNIYARSFGLLDTPGFSQELVRDMLTLVAEYRQKMQALNPQYTQIFHTPFFNDLNELFKIHMNTTLGLEVEISMQEYPEKMRMIFEDGELMRNVLGLGFVPYASQLIFELHYQPSTQQFTVATLYNWEELALGGACGNDKRCPYSNFAQYIADNTVNATLYRTLCGETAE